MNFFNRAIASISRRPGKTIILLILVFILGSVIAGAISVEGAISNTDANLRRNMQPIVSINSDWEAFNDSPESQEWRELTESWTWEDWDYFWDNFDIDDPNQLQSPQMEQLTPDHLRAAGALPQVAHFDFMIRTWIEGIGLARYDGGNDWSNPEGVPNQFTIRGTNTTEFVIFTEGMYTLTQGRQFAPDELIPGQETAPVIISEELAMQNNLQLGSTINLMRPVQFPSDPEGDGWSDGCWTWGPECFTDEFIFAWVPMNLVVVGLFDIPEDEAASNDPWGGGDWQRIDNLNGLYVPNWIIEENEREVQRRGIEAWDYVDFETPPWLEEHANWIEDEDNMRFNLLPIFILEDPLLIDEFREAIADVIPPFWVVEDLSSTFDDIASSMETMQNIANWILYVSIGATLLILSLLITLFLRDRRYEMGVYLALGEKKGRIILQILLEVVVTSFVGITFAVFAGNIISSQISSNMLMNEITAQREANNDPWGGGWSSNWSILDEIGIPTTELSISEMMEAFEVRLSLYTVGLFYGVGLGAVILSTVVPIIFVVSLNPKKVLM